MATMPVQMWLSMTGKSSKPAGPVVLHSVNG
jgi:hypothetical protein